MKRLAPTRVASVLLLFLVPFLYPQIQPPMPPNAGLYYLEAGRIQKMEGQVVSFGRTGSLLASTFTFGVKSRKTNAQILGTHALLKVSPLPVFLYRVPPASEAVGSSAGDLVLVKLKRKGDRRQFELAAAGAWRASTGISIRQQVQFYRTELSTGVYKLALAQQLKRGEYAFYLFRGYDLPGFIYDFSVE